MMIDTLSSNGLISCKLACYHNECLEAGHSKERYCHILSIFELSRKTTLLHEQSGVSTRRSYTKYIMKNKFIT